MLALRVTPPDHLPSRLGLSWAWSWIGRVDDDKTVGVAVKTNRRTLLLCWRKP